MRCIIIAAALAVVLVAASAVPTGGLTKPFDMDRECTEGASWGPDACNTCHCTGGRGACTLMLCFSPDGKTDDSQNNRKCQPAGAAWKGRNADCVCNASGKTECTETPQADQPQGDEPQPAQEQQPTCKSGSSWSDGCNNCTCTEAGIPACTLKLCLKTEKCTPGAVWRRDCNTCRCGPDGEPACTKMMCVPQKPPNQETAMGRCTPGVQWKEECNTCWCSEAGERACTEIDCSGRPVYSILVQRFRRQASCQPGTHWKKDCNTCHCSDNGVPFCTYRLCLTPGQVQDMSGLVERTRREGSERMEGEQ